MGIEFITDSRIYLDHIDWLKDIPFIDMSYTDCLARCLSGQYKGLLGTIDDTPAGIMVYYIYNQDRCFIVGIWARKNLSRFLDSGIALLKGAGIKVVRCTSTIHDYEKIAGMTKVYTTYERHL